MTRLRPQPSAASRFAAAVLGLAVWVPAGSSTADFESPAVNIPGIEFGESLGRPPDPVGDVGAGYYVQMTNGLAPLGARVEIFTDAGAPASGGPFRFNLLSPSGGTCDSFNQDPIVLYDELAERWLLSVIGNSHLCILISRGKVPTSQSSDWYYYEFPASHAAFDYQKIAVWPEAYYLSTYESNTLAVYALDRTRMLAGDPARPIQRETVEAPHPSLLIPGLRALLPADLDGAPPPPGSPGFFVNRRDDEMQSEGTPDPTRDFLDIWAISVDFDDPGNTTFTALPSIPIADFDSDLCGVSTQNQGCIPQKDTTVTLHPLPFFTMWRLQYRNFETHETLVGNFTVDASGSEQIGIRWFELRRTPPGFGDWSLFQEGTHAPDANHRWMGSIAMDAAGNIALGYSLSGTTLFPSVGYAGRLTTDPPGSMAAGEVVAFPGEYAASAARWGDYSSMNVDPETGCGFWYTSEYVGNASNEWATRIVSTSFPECPVANDSDRDLWPDPLDNCPQLYNPHQLDSDGDGVGDLCDSCRLVDPGLEAACDGDGDGWGNHCDCDLDQDGDCDFAGDNAVFLQAFADYSAGNPFNEAADLNCDGAVDFGTDFAAFLEGFQAHAAGEVGPGFEWLNSALYCPSDPDPSLPDSDGDGIADPCDTCAGFDPGAAAACDADADGFGNHCDCDLDQDGDCDVADTDLVIAASQQQSGGGSPDPAADLNCDGVVDVIDVTRAVEGKAAYEASQTGAPFRWLNSGRVCAGEAPCPPQ